MPPETLPTAEPREQPEGAEVHDSKKFLDSLLKNVVDSLVKGKTLDWKKLWEDVLLSISSGGKIPAPGVENKKHEAPTQEYLLNNLLKGEVAVQNLNNSQRQALAKKVFGDGPGAKLLIALDSKFGGKGEMILRMIALGKHEGQLLFGRTNPDPASGSNRGTFQIGGIDSTSASTKSKYDAMLAKGAAMYTKLLGEPLDTSSLNNADKDIIAHMGHIEDRSNMQTKSPTKLFEELSSSTISDEALVSLMHKKIQGGIRAVGTEVLAMTRKGSLKVKVDELS